MKTHQNDINTFFKGKVIEKKKRSQVIDSDPDDEEVVVMAKKKKLSPLKQAINPVSPSDFFNSSKAVQSSVTMSRAVVTPKKDEVIDMDGDINDKDFEFISSTRIHDDDSLAIPSTDDAILIPEISPIMPIKIGGKKSSEGKVSRHVNDKDFEFISSTKIHDDDSLAIPSTNDAILIPEISPIMPIKVMAQIKNKISGKKEIVQNVDNIKISIEEDIVPVAVKEVLVKPKSNYQQYMASKTTHQVTESRELPIGAKDCLLNMTFVFTGDLKSLDRSKAADLVKSYGGKVTTGPSKKTTYVVVGAEPGPKKMEKIEALGIKVLDEDQFYQLISSTSKCQTFDDGELIKDCDSDLEIISSEIKPFPKSDITSTSLQNNQAILEAPIIKATSVDILPKNQTKSIKPALSITKLSNKGKSSIKAGGSNNELWTVKYKPKSYSEIIGNKGSIDKLAQWLNYWLMNLIRSNNRQKGFPKAGKDDSSQFRAALISGPPGIGKTSAAHMVTQLEGFELIEFNASDSRSKKTLENVVKETTYTTSIKDLFRSKSNHQSGSSRKVLVMDEVDGMSAGDRGGAAELIQLIKKTNIPIICICNDRGSPKVRSLANHCLDLRFRRPTALQVETRIKKVCASEGLKVGSNVIGELVQCTSGDIRQILNLLSTYRLTAETIDFKDSKKISSAMIKNVTLSPFDITGKLLNGSAYRASTLIDKIDLYFQDYSLIPLFIQENYIKMNPAMKVDAGQQKPRNTLQLLSEAADSISIGDLIDSAQRKENSWSLLPIHAVMSTVRPCFFIHGNMQGMYQFPGWLGQNSKGNKSSRLLREIEQHMRIKISGDKTEIRMNYLPLLASVLTRPLENDDIESVIATMDTYYLDREDWDSIMELGYQDLASKISTKAKGTFTRNHPSPFISGIKKGGGSLSISESTPDCDDIMVEDEAVDDEAENEDLLVGVKLKLIKKNVPAKTKASAKSIGKKRSVR